MAHETYGKVGLLLNGAGAKGIIQSGMAKAVFDHGIEYDTMYGSSAGSLNGILIHQGHMDQMKDLWMNIKTSDIYKWSLWDAINPFTKKACLFDSSPLLDTITRNLDFNAIYGNPRNFVISATDYTTWAPFFAEVKTLSEEELPLALYASASPPIYFPFVKLRGQLLSDAGVLTNYNINQAVKDGMDTLIVLGFAVPEPHEPVDVRDNVSETFSIAMQGYFEKELSFVEQINKVISVLPPNTTPYRPIKVVKIVPPKATGIALLDFDYKQDREELWQSGYDLAKEILERELPCAPTS